jgi:hypothetical protein
MARYVGNVEVITETGEVIERIQAELWSSVDAAGLGRWGGIIYPLSTGTFKPWLYEAFHRRQPVTLRLPSGTAGKAELAQTGLVLPGQGTTIRGTGAVPFA